MYQGKPVCVTIMLKFGNGTIRDNYVRTTKLQPKEGEQRKSEFK